MAQHVKTSLIALLAVTLMHAVYGWAPGECHKAGATAARCCEHEAYWCHGGNNRALAHCHFCQEECIKVADSSVCVWGGTWPGRYQKCFNGVEWFKVCSSIPNDATLGGGAWNHVDRQSVTEPVDGSARGALRGMSAAKAVELKSVARVSVGGDDDELDASVKARPSPLANQVQFVIQIMGDVINGLRSATISNTIESARSNANRAVEALEFLVDNLVELVELFPSGDRGLARISINRFQDAVVVVRSSLMSFLAADTTVEAVQQTCQRVLDDLRNEFWTRAQVALNAYVAFERFTADWAPWLNAIRDWFNN